MADEDILDNSEAEKVEEEQTEEEEEEIPENAFSLKDPDLDFKPGHGFYKGPMIDGKRSGYGTYYFLSGARYTGQWINGMKHGDGTFVYPDGSRYVGQWMNDTKHGYGSYYYSNGDTFDGEWRFDQRHGSGVYFHADSKCRYKGYWRDGKLNGPVTIMMNDVRYTGTFCDDNPQGRGIFVLPRGLAIRGKFITRGRTKVPVWFSRGLGPAYP